MKVYIAAIHGHVPGDMVRCLSAFTNCCYIVRCNAITTSDIVVFQRHLSDFHQFRQIFITTDVRKDFALPRQHALMHYANAIELFGSPNGTCTSQTESKHKKAVKEPWRRSNRNKPLLQMIESITRMDKLSELRQVFEQCNMLVGSVSEYTAQGFAGKLPTILPWRGASTNFPSDGSDSNSEDDEETVPVPGPRRNTKLWLASRKRKFWNHFENCTDFAIQRLNIPPTSPPLQPLSTSLGFRMPFEDLSMSKTIQIHIIQPHLTTHSMDRSVSFTLLM
jgi:hypothetical protein